VLSSSKIDSIFKQLYLILFQISEIEDVFETVHFKQDRVLVLNNTGPAALADSQDVQLGKP
jgi:hypothetical protein